MERDLFFLGDYMTSIYQSIYTLLENSIFGGTASTATYGVFFCEGISIIACALLVALPFVLVWRIIRRFL